LPKHVQIDIRRFEDNMGTVVKKMHPFRHEFYAIAIKVEGKGEAISGHHTNFPLGSTVFFNSPFQILSWDIFPDWQGYYIMISQDFIAKSKHFTNLLEEFPFLKLDKSIPFEIKRKDVAHLLDIFEKIWFEYYGDNTDKFNLIESYLLLLLNHVKRYFTKNITSEDANKQIRKADLKLVTRFQTLIETSFYPDVKIEDESNLHSPSYYSQKLCVHPNHLNAVVKSITGQTALSIIQNHLLHLTKSYLAQTDLSVKEIAYTLYFDSPNNFNTFFKKHTDITPLAYRKKQNL